MKFGIIGGGVMGWVIVVEEFEYLELSFFDEAFRLRFLVRLFRVRGEVCLGVVVMTVVKYC